MPQLIALVNPNDEIIGYDNKTVVHQKGLLHRAFSILIFNSKGEMLLQRRALSKYHSPGLWTNTCCSHLPKGLEMESIIHERLQEEMGFDSELKHTLAFHYQVNFGDGMIENEIDHIYIGFFNGNPIPNPTEVCEWAWRTKDYVLEEVKNKPEKYTYWFKNILENYFDSIEEKLKGC
ncbi:MAG: isopentenyl-diphosphate Delta-isomerase [Bacteroidales bacterium]|nr:isopentenyl-diphosphate Delta-isomerase [Bacteroidales bacterium]